jgi:hypothetical protein
VYGLHVLFQPSEYVAKNPLSLGLIVELVVELWPGLEGKVLRVPVGKILAAIVVGDAVGLAVH